MLLFFWIFHIVLHVYTYAEFVKLGQTGPLLGPIEVASSFQVKTGILSAQAMPIPVTTGANREANVVKLGIYRPNTGANRGGVFNVLSL